MLALYLLAAHLVGDFLLQTRWQAIGKFGWTPEAVWLRGKHVATYGWCFAVALIVAGEADAGAVWFLAALLALHFLTDGHRFERTPGEATVWAMLSRERRREEWPEGHAPRSFQMPPNPWPALPLAIDQTLHVVQIAVLAGLFLA
jgi:hypothetical protein